MEEINLKDLLNFFIRKIPVIILITILVMALGISYTVFLKTPLYHGKTTLILLNNEGDQTTVTQSDIVLNQKLVAAYSEIIKSRRVLNQVIEELGLELAVEDLSEKVSVSSVSNTEIIKISVSDEDAKLAVRIADTIAAVFKTEVMELYNLENVSLIDRAEEEIEPYNIRPLRDFVLYFAVGVVVSCGMLMMVYYFDTSIKSSEMIEERLGVPVIGNIPLSGKSKKSKKNKRGRK